MISRNVFAKRCATAASASRQAVGSINQPLRAKAPLAAHPATASGAYFNARQLRRRGLRALWRGRRCIVPDWWNRAWIPLCKALPMWSVRPSPQVGKIRFQKYTRPTVCHDQKPSTADGDGWRNDGLNGWRIASETPGKTAAVRQRCEQQKTSEDFRI